MSTINSQPSTSSDVVIRVDNLSKKYLLHHQQRERYTALRDVIARGAKNLGRKILNFKSSTFNTGSSTLNSQPSTTEEFYALKDISFEIKQGERVGIIGRNGAGKTTLLKLLSRITEPTTGRITLKGRVASLLEVGTGFHPELTGRENIFLNGAILGMGKAEIKKKFDEIVDFAEIEKFLDTPVKRYSSGMYVRLAFAVAAHLEPEILLVDEVLAVGDTQFQKKCLGKMNRISKEGRTILFVSHNMSAIQTFCNRCIVVKFGEIIADKSPNMAVQIYLSETIAANSFTRPMQNNGYPTVTSGSFDFIQQNGYEHLKIDLEIQSGIQKKLSLDIRLANNNEVPIGFGSMGAFDPKYLLEINPRRNNVSLLFPIYQLAVGTYYISIDLTIPDVEYFDRAENCLLFEITRPPHEGARMVLSQTWGYGSYEIPIKLLTSQ
jgi:lipopolysaccharide transport system ATP-binding protein